LGFIPDAWVFSLFFQVFQFGLLSRQVKAAPEGLGFSLRILREVPLSLAYRYSSALNYKWISRFF
jgi:hypothetical protein